MSHGKECTLVFFLGVTFVRLDGDPLHDVLICHVHGLSGHATGIVVKLYSQTALLLFKIK